MRLIPLIKMKYYEYETAVKTYLASKLSDLGTRFGSSTVFGQLLSVLSSTTENTMSYIEDAMTEQNKYTAQRKRSIYSLAGLSGYVASMGHAAAANLRVSFKPNNAVQLNVVIPNHTKITCLQTGLQYNLILPQETIIMNLTKDNTTKQLYAVQGKFETQKFVSKGGKLYSQLVRTSGDVDSSYITVKINGDTWSEVASIADMLPDGREYIIRPANVGGFVVTFGNGPHGRFMNEGDNIEITYLIHDGESGNIDPQRECVWQFTETLKDISGEDVDGNEVLYVTCDQTHGVTSGTYSETTEQVRAAIGTNSRSLVLADPKNYTNLINRFSFCGTNRTWSEEGSLVIHSIIMRNYRDMMRSGKDYFSLGPEDFVLTDTQKDSVISTVENSGQQLAGAVYTIFDPELCKYAMYLYIKMKDVNYDETIIRNKIEDLVGQFFADIENDLFIPKSDIIHLLKKEIPEIDGVDVYFMSERNEQAIMQGWYIKKTYTYNPGTQKYVIKSEKVAVPSGTNPNVGLDEHGNIYLDTNDQFPVLMGNWMYQYTNNVGGTDIVNVTDPLTIVFK